MPKASRRTRARKQDDLKNTLNNAGKNAAFAAPMVNEQRKQAGKPQKT